MPLMTVSRASPVAFRRREVGAWSDCGRCGRRLFSARHRRLHRLLACPPSEPVRRRPAALHAAPPTLPQPRVELYKGLTLYFCPLREQGAKFKSRAKAHIAAKHGSAGRGRRRREARKKATVKVPIPRTPKSTNPFRCDGCTYETNVRSVLVIHTKRLSACKKQNNAEKTQAMRRRREERRVKREAEGDSSAKDWEERTCDGCLEQPGKLSAHIAKECPVLGRFRCPGRLCGAVAVGRTALEAHKEGCRRFVRLAHQRELFPRAAGGGEEAEEGEVGRVLPPCPSCGVRNQRSLLLGHFYAGGLCSLQRVVGLVGREAACPHCRSAVPEGGAEEHLGASPACFDALSGGRQTCSDCGLQAPSHFVLRLHRDSVFGCLAHKLGILAAPASLRASKQDLSSSHLGEAVSERVEKKHQCSGEDCGFGSSSKRELAEHERRCAGLAESCSGCVEGSECERCLGETHAAELGGPTGLCPSCGVEAKGQLFKHFYGHLRCRIHLLGTKLHEEGADACPSCGQELEGGAAEAKKHLRQRPKCLRGMIEETGDFRCDECGARVDEELKLELHLRSATGCRLFRSRRASATDERPGDQAPQRKPRQAFKALSCACGAELAALDSVDEHERSCPEHVLREHREELFGSGEGPCPGCERGVRGQRLQHFYGKMACLTRREAEGMLGEAGCGACGAVGFASLREAGAHLRSRCIASFASGETFHCPKCSVRLENKAKLEKHEASRWGCRAVELGLLSRHKESRLKPAKEEDDGLSNCLCGAEFSTEDELEEHKENCPEFILRAHRDELFDEQSQKCPGCDKVVQSNRLPHFYSQRETCLVRSVAERLLNEGKCRACGVSAFASLRDVTHHLSSLCREEYIDSEVHRVTCPKCGVSLENEAKLGSHEASRWGCRAVRLGLVGREAEQPETPGTPKARAEKASCPGGACSFKGDRAAVEAHLEGCAEGQTMRHLEELCPQRTECPCGYACTSRPAVLRHVLSLSGCALQRLLVQRLAQEQGCHRCGKTFHGARPLAEFRSHIRFNAKCRRATEALLVLEAVRCDECGVRLSDTGKLAAHLTSGLGCRLHRQGLLPVQGESQQETQTTAAEILKPGRCPGVQCSFRSGDESEVERHVDGCEEGLVGRHLGELCPVLPSCGACLTYSSRRHLGLLQHFLSPHGCFLELWIQERQGREAGCPKCGRHFGSAREFRRHLRESSRCRLAMEARNFQPSAACVDCGLRLSSAAKVAAHRSSGLGCRLHKRGLLGSAQGQGADKGSQHSATGPPIPVLLNLSHTSQHQTAHPKHDA